MIINRDELDTKRVPVGPYDCLILRVIEDDIVRQSIGGESNGLTLREVLYTSSIILVLVTSVWSQYSHLKK